MPESVEHRLRLRNRTKIAQQSSKDPDSGCVIWNGQISNGGYGQVMLRHDGFNKMHSAHRASYELFVGEIPKGKIILQSCRNRLCVNPEHLTVVSEVPKDYWHSS